MVCAVISKALGRAASGTWLVGALAMLCAAGPVHAQLASGYAGQSGGPTAGVPDDYWYLLRQIGPCVAASKTEEARAFLATVPGTATEKRAFDRVFGRKRNVCMRHFVNATFVRAHLRGAIAEGLYERMPGGTRTSTQPAGTAIDRAGIRTLHDFARCYIAGNPAEAGTLLSETQLGSQEEVDAVMRLSTGFESCFPLGRKVRIDATEVRMAIAEALYHANNTLSAEG